MHHILKKTGSLLLTELTLCAPGPFPAASASAESAPTDKPKIRLSPEIEIKPELRQQTPVKAAVDSAAKDDKNEKPGWFSRNKWWVLLGAVAAGTVAAWAGGGGSDGG